MLSLGLSLLYFVITPVSPIQTSTTDSDVPPSQKYLPNFLFLFPDQWRFDWDGFHDSPAGEIPLQVPTIRQLAKRGVRFTQAYVPAPTCAPSRSALASGREYDHTGVPSNQFDYPLDKPTFYALLRNSGYHTITAGKDDLTKGSLMGVKTHFKGCRVCKLGDGFYHQFQLGFSDGLRNCGKVEVAFPKEPHDMFGYYLQNQTTHTRQGKQITGWEVFRACLQINPALGQRGVGRYLDAIDHEKERGGDVAGIINQALPQDLRKGPISSSIEIFSEVTQEASKYRNESVVESTDCDRLTYTSKYDEDDWITNNAIKLLQRRPQDRPFFLQVAFAGPHSPFLVTAPERAAVDGRIWPRAMDGRGGNYTTPGGVCKGTQSPSRDRIRCNYAAEIENLDRQFKRILDEVAAQGVINHTLVVFSSDHGDMLGDHGAIEKSLPWQGSVSVPLIIAGPGVVQGKIVRDPVATLDLAGTFLDYGRAGRAKGMTTMSLRGHLEDPRAAVRSSERHGPVPTKMSDVWGATRQSVSSGLNNFRLVVKDVEGVVYKYICCRGPCPNPPSTLSGPRAGWSWMEILIDVNKDPFDMVDLSKKRLEVVRELRSLLPQEGYQGNFTEGCASIQDALHAPPKRAVVLGIRMDNALESHGVSFDTANHKLVTSVAEQSLAQAFGVQVGWVLQSVNGQLVNSSLEMQEALERTPLGEKFTIVFAAPVPTPQQHQKVLFHSSAAPESRLQQHQKLVLHSPGDFELLNSVT